MNSDVVNWTALQVKEILPGLDDASLLEAVKYSLSMPPDDTDRHWTSLLGSGPQVEPFLKQLRVRRLAKPQRPTHPVQPVPTRLHAPAPISLSQSRGLSSIDTSRTPSPSKVLRITSKPIPRKKGQGKLTSDLGKPKPKPPPVNPVIQAANENRPLTELEEIDSALQAITITKKRTECGCFGTRHDVYPLAPNCLTCGRIICVAEGFGACFSCGNELISEDQRDALVRELRVERGLAKTKAANEKVRKVKAGDQRHRVWATKAGGQEHVVDPDSSDASPFASGNITPFEDGGAYLEAERKRDELLEFDRTFAQRTKIIDQQAEFTPQSILHDSFSTPQERAAALRRMQKIEAEQAAAERARSRRVLEIDFQTGKGNVRNARAEDILPAQTTSPEEAQNHERVARETVEIVNGFEKPTFVET